MRSIHLNAYRFSLSWPRILPAGRGKVNAKGLDFYDRLVDGLLASGIHPLVTLYHWDLPQTIQDAGGWLNRGILDWFADYAAVCVKRLGDRVKDWATINEPNVVAYCGYEGGWHAPGVKDKATARQVFHHLMVAHGRAVRAMRSLRPKARFGICPNIAMQYPARPNNAGDRSVTAEKWVSERWCLDPFLLGRYPREEWKKAEKEGWAPLMASGDLKEACAPIEFLGINYYFSFVWKRLTKDRWMEVKKPCEGSALGWPFWPDGLRDTLLWVTKTYGRRPILVTENGAAFFGEKPGRDCRVHDSKRARYLEIHARAVGQAIKRGADVRGYYVWSLMDNFEWNSGFKPRFGLVHVDYTTQRRTVKDSGWFYSRVASTNGSCLEDGNVVK